MNLLQLTSTNTYEKFYIQAELIEKIMKSDRGESSEILLTTGRWVSCAESRCYSKRVIK